MATKDGLIARARLELGDLPQAFQTRVVGDGITNVVNLSYKPVEPTTLQVVLRDTNGVLPLVAGVDYTLDADRGILTFTPALVQDAVVVVTGTAFRYFSDTDWGTFVDTAVLQHLHNRDGVSLANMPAVEEYPVSLLAVTEALYALINDAAFDIDIATPEGVSIPRHQRYQQLTEMLLARLDQYNKLSSALNVGLYRIEMFDLRRVSRQTNKLVPIYRAQELEDIRFPVRAFPPIDLKAGSPSPDSVPDVSITIIQGRPFTTTVDVNQDLTGKQIVVTMRKYKAGAALRYFTVQIVDAPGGLFTASLAADVTYNLGGGPYWWDVRLISDGVPDEVLEGQVLIEERPRV